MAKSEGDTNRIKVTASELHARWMSDDAAGMTDDRQRRMRVVQMFDGTEYETSFDEVKALQRKQAKSA